MRSYGLQYAIVEVSVRLYGGILKDCRRVFTGGYLGLIGGFKTFWGCWRSARAERARKLGGAFAQPNDRPSGARAVRLPRGCQRSAVSGQRICDPLPTQAVSREASRVGIWYRTLHRPKRYAVRRAVEPFDVNPQPTQAVSGKPTQAVSDPSGQPLAVSDISPKRSAVSDPSGQRSTRPKRSAANPTQAVSREASHP